MTEKVVLCGDCETPLGDGEEIYQCKKCGKVFCIGCSALHLGDCNFEAINELVEKHFEIVLLDEVKETE